MADKSMFAVGGLWREWDGVDGPGCSFTQLTINADDHPLMQRFHKPGDEKRALVSVNMMLLLIGSWILAYAGIFFLGFGGARWTSDMALNYFRTVLSSGAQLLTMVLLVGIGKSFLDAYHLNMSGIKLSELGIILVISVVLLVLVNKLPGLVGGLAMGGGTGALGSGLGAGSVMAGAAMTAAAVSTAGSALRIAAGTVDSLVGGMAKMAKDSMSDRISNTYGGRLASVIRAGANDGNA